MSTFENEAPVWLFGYGSLIFKVDFPYLERRRASIRHWVRRFWQGSHDHRGTQASPGRVVTLVPEHSAVCKGMAYLVAPDVFGHLDFREKNGYRRVATELLFDEGDRSQGLVYIATEKNPAYLGPASEAEIARHIARAVGPSGSNRDYLARLAEALRQLGEHDAHIFTIEEQLAALGAAAPDAL